MTMETAKLFQNGHSQAVRLPRAFRMPGEEVFIEKFGETTLLIPKQDPWQALFNSLDQFSDDFMPTREQGEYPQRDDLFE